MYNLTNQNTEKYHSIYYLRGKSKKKYVKKSKMRFFNQKCLKFALIP
jgi:hypothetical protein